jgi:hypothetical protein
VIKGLRKSSLQPLNKVVLKINQTTKIEMAWQYLLQVYYTSFRLNQCRTCVVLLVGEQMDGHYETNKNCSIFYRSVPTKQQRMINYPQYRHVYYLHRQFLYWKLTGVKGGQITDWLG